MTARSVLPVAPSLAPTLEGLKTPHREEPISRRTWVVAGLAVGVALAAASVAQLLARLIGLVTNLAFYGRLDASFTSPAGNHLGWFVVAVPVAGGLIVGVMARFGSSAIRGHGIPEAMERVLFHESRIPKRITFLKPVSAAIAIGTGGPFGAEGPIIATGGALGSLVGQLLRVSAHERKTLLAAGAAAGMSATFGSPVSAVLLAVELLLFEYRARSLIPVALASATACGARYAFTGTQPAFAMPVLDAPTGSALVIYVVIGALVGVASVAVTRAVYWVEGRFEKLPVHWMWWPAIGAVAVGLCGVAAPHSLGVGYDNIDRLLTGELAGRAMLVLVGFKLVSWTIALGSGTSGGTLAPLLTIGGGVGSVLGALAVLGGAGGVDVRVAALVGMAAMFAGASRALLASVVFAFEATRQPMGLLPLLGGCAAAFLVSARMMRHSIMTERLARRGARIVSDYTADRLQETAVGSVATAKVLTLEADRSLATVREWLASRAPGTTHQGFPVLDDGGELLGVVTRRDLLDEMQLGERRVRDVVKRPVAVVFDDSSLREAVEHMVGEGVGRLPVVTRTAPRRLVGIITRSDLLTAQGRR